MTGENSEKDQKKGETLQGTLFIIEGAWGYGIKPYSIYKGEEGVLLERPERGV